MQGLRIEHVELRLSDTLALCDCETEMIVALHRIDFTARATTSAYAVSFFQRECSCSPWTPPGSCGIVSGDETGYRR